jgi:hypothetical protein
MPASCLDSPVAGDFVNRYAKVDRLQGPLRAVQDCPCVSGLPPQIVFAQQIVSEFAAGLTDSRFRQLFIPARHDDARPFPGALYLIHFNTGQGIGPQPTVEKL